MNRILLLIFFYTQLNCYNQSIASEENSENSENSTTIPLEMLLGSLLNQPSGESSEKALTHEKLYKKYDYSKETKPQIFFPHKVCDDMLLLNKIFANESLKNKIRTQIDQPLSLLVYGPEGVGKRTFIHWAAAKYNITIYEFDYKGIPDEIKAKIIISDLESIEGDSLNNSIIFFRDIGTKINLSVLLNSDKFDSISKKATFIFTAEVDTYSYNNMLEVKEFTSFMKINIKAPTLEQKIKIIKSLLSKKDHSLNRGKIKEFSSSIKTFNGHEVKKLLDQAYKASILNETPLSLDHIKSAQQCSLLKGLENPLAHCFT
jgi:hypothetical protein